MTTEEISAVLKERFGEHVVDASYETAHPHVVVDRQAWSEIAAFLRDDARLGFDLLRCITAVDQLEDGQLVAAYDLFATAGSPGRPENWTRRHELCVKIKVPRDDARIPSVADVWPAADWHEREAYDLMGIVFDGHPDPVDGPEGTHPRRILCPDDWAGHPLRKDYEFPLEYHGIPAVTEYGQTRPVH